MIVALASPAERGSLMVMGVGCVLVVSGGCCWWMLVDGDGDGVCR